jgi:hypothetical protein
MTPVRTRFIKASLSAGRINLAGLIAVAPIMPEAICSGKPRQTRKPACFFR